MKTSLDHMQKQKNATHRMGGMHQKIRLAHQQWTKSHCHDKLNYSPLIGQPGTAAKEHCKAYA